MFISIVNNIMTFFKKRGGSIMPPAKLLLYRYMVVPLQYGLVYLVVLISSTKFGDLSHYE